MPKVKIIVLSVSYFMLVLFLNVLLRNLVHYSTVFNFNTFQLIQVLIVSLLLFIVSTFFFTIRDVWIKILLSPGIFAIATFLVMGNVDLNYAFFSSVISFLLLTYSTYISYQNAENLIKFDPRTSMGIVIRTTIRTIAIVGAVYMLLSPIADDTNTITKTITGIAQSQVNTFMGARQDLVVMEKSGLFDFNIERVLQEKISEFIEPYKFIVAPALSLLTFAFLHLVLSTMLAIYNVVIVWIFKMSVKSGVIKIEKKMVEKEIPVL